MGEELLQNQLFIKDKNGEYVPYEGIKPADILVCDELTEEQYESLPKEGVIEFKPVEMNFEIQQTKDTIKWIRKMRNILGRRIRYEKRLKEYARRRKLKGYLY